LDTEGLRVRVCDRVRERVTDDDAVDVCEDEEETEADAEPERVPIALESLKAMPSGSGVRVSDCEGVVLRVLLDVGCCEVDAVGLRDRDWLGVRGARR